MKNTTCAIDQIVLFGVFRTADLEQQYDTVSHIGSIFSFNSTIHSGVSYSAWYATLPYQVVHPIGLSLLMHYIRRDAPLYFTTPAYPGFLHLVGFSWAWARAYYYFLVQSVTRCFIHPRSHFV